jgi:two-component system, chemotaxis family, sensor kinase CheA
VNRDELHRRLLETFALEMEEHLQTMADILWQMTTEENAASRAYSAEQLNLLFRAVHSLKGAATSVDLTDIEDHCHRLESLLATVRSEMRILTQDEVHKLNEGLLWLQQKNLQSGQPDRGAVQPHTKPSPLDRAVNTAPQAADAAANADTAGEQVTPALSDKGQNSVRLPAARLDRLLSLLSEIQLVTHSGEYLLQNIDELNALLIQLSQASAKRWQPYQRQTASVSGNRHSVAPRPHSRRNPDDQRHLQVKHLIRALRKRTAKYLLELELAIQPLEREIHSSRLQSFRTACESIQTFVNTQQSAGKSKVRLMLEGQDVELDRALIEGLRPVLMHLVRNALDHGIEPVHKRLQHGKPERGEVRIKALRVKGHTQITIQDDGQGVDEEKLVAAMKNMGLAIPRDRASLLNTLFEPGLSTAAVVSNVSGRGVGLDAVRGAIIAMRGTIVIESVTGKGTTFKIQLPQTLSAYRVLIVAIGQCRYALDAAQVKLTRRLKQHEVIETDQGGFIAIDTTHYQVGSLEKHLGSGSTQAHYAVVVTDGRTEKALLVDQVVGLESVVVKDLEAKLGKVEGVSGGAMMSDGSVALMLDPAFFLKQHHVRPGRLAANDATTDKLRKVTVLVVEDAMTTRMLEVNVLESAGYQVIATVDGQQAWESLRDNIVDVIVSDVDMPRLNGFELTRRIRDSAKWSHIPVILLTARENPEDKLEGLHAGANIYMKKSHFDQAELLEAVNRLAPL